MAEDLGALGSATPDHGSAVAPSTFAFQGDSDDLGVPADQGAMGLVGPVTGASGGNNPAQPGPATAPGQP